MNMSHNEEVVEHTDEVKDRNEKVMDHYVLRQS